MTTSLMIFAGLLSGLLLSPPQAVPAAINPNKPLTVCQAIQNREQYRGKIIELEGEWNGAVLFGTCPPLKTGPHTWPNAVIVTFPTDRHLDAAANWTVDMNAFRNAQTKAENLLRSGTEAIKATIVGRFESRPALYAQPDLNGYGDGNAAPAQLVIISVKTVGGMTKPR